MNAANACDAMLAHAAAVGFWVGFVLGVAITAAFALTSGPDRRSHLTGGDRT